MKWSRLLISCTVVIACLAGCADFARWVRQYTYPQDFRYIESDQLRSTMGQLARQAVEQEPLNYPLTYSVTGACVYCHARR